MWCYNIAITPFDADAYFIKPGKNSNHDKALVETIFELSLNLDSVVPDISWGSQIAVTMWKFELQTSYIQGSFT